MIKSDINITKLLSFRVTALVSPAKHQQKYYQSEGWWTGQRLERRFEEFVSQDPAALAVADCSGREMTRESLWENAGTLATCLSAVGISQDSVVMLFIPNRIEWQIALLAVLRLHAVPASIATKTDDVALRHAMDISNCDTVITSALVSDASLTRMVVRIADARTSSAATGPGIVEIEAGSQPKWVRKKSSSCDKEKKRDELEHVMFTSSTTGLPKGVTHTVDTLGCLNLQFMDRFSLDVDTPIFMASPLGHSVGAIHGARLSLYAGAALILQDKWQPAEAVAMMQKYRCEFTAAATPFLKDLVDYASAEPIASFSLRSFLCGGAPVPPDLLEQAWERFPHTFVTNLWGMTEGGLVTCVKESPKQKLVETAGIGLPGLELRIVDSDGSELGEGEEGELTMRGPGVFTGYIGQDDLYQSLITADGFFHTGDLSRIDGDGYVCITGRIKDLIVRGGVNISPLPIEAALAKHPELESVAVVGFPDDRLGERICAVIQPKTRRPAKNELVEFAVAEGLSKRQLPELVRYVAKMPRTAAGKIRKPDLQRLINSVPANQDDLDD